MTRRTVRLGAGAGFAGDRIDPAVDLARRGRLDYLIFECLGERTVAAGQARRLHDPGAGYDPLLGRRLRAVLPACRGAGTTVVTNAGSANPEAAGELATAIVKELGLQGLKIAVITGDDVLQAVSRTDPEIWETGAPLSACADELISANAYLGAEPVVEALRGGAGLVITGRITDPALYLGPLMHEFGWRPGDEHRLGQGTMVGHLLECAGQLTGGYFADPGTKPVTGMARLGFPFADVSDNGNAVLAKLPGTGGRLDARTCAEQLLYEVDDPTGYVTPDVTADFTNVTFTQTAEHEVRAEGATGHRRPECLKVSLGFRGGWEGEGQISYAGPRCLDRARLAADIVRERLVSVHGLEAEQVSVEYIGAAAAFRGLMSPPDPAEVRLRVSARVPTAELAETVGWEVESLYTNGPAGGGGARTDAREVVVIRSCLIPRDHVTPAIRFVEP